MTKKDYIIPSLGLLCVIGLVINGPIPQQQSYHNFADQREILGIPNFLNVITNLPFAIIGVAEIFDKEIYYMLGKSISGHSLNHLFMAVSCYRIVVLIGRRATSNEELI